METRLWHMKLHIQTHNYIAQGFKRIVIWFEYLNWHALLELFKEISCWLNAELNYAQMSYFLSCNDTFSYQIETIYQGKVSTC